MLDLNLDFIDLALGMLGTTEPAASAEERGCGRRD
jgi:hypothetical protein